MKKYSSIILSILCILILAGCSKKEQKVPDTLNAMVPSIIYQGSMYRTTGKQIPAEVDESAIVGEISSVVPLTQLPTKEGEANFGEIGDQYAITSDGLLVKMNNEWTLFELPDIEAEETWGITLTAETVTPTSAAIKCTQSGGEPTGELQTGSWYILERWTQENGWREMPYVIDGEIGWTAEAWMIPMNGACEWQVNWEWLYGAIPAGKYRIGKELMDFRGPGDFDKAIYFVEFSIEKDETISFHNKTFNKSDLSKETIEWLENYDNLSKEEQLAISSIPADLYDLCGYPKASDVPME